MLIMALMLQILSQYAIVVVMYYRFEAFSGCEWFISRHPRHPYIIDQVTNQPIASIPYQGCFYEKVVPFWT